MPNLVVPTPKLSLPENDGALLKPLAYLREAVGRSETDEATAAGVADLLFRLSLLPLPVSAPDIGVAEDGRIFLLWDNDTHYLEAEVFPGGKVEFFYRNRETGELWEAEGVLGQALPDGLNERLRLFSR